MNESAFIAIGSNVEPAKNIRDALALLDKSVPVIAISTIYREPAIGHREQPPFYNGVVKVQTRLSPASLKWDLLRGIEATLGRHRSSDKYAPRTIDLDLILYGERVLTRDDLMLPDPNIFERAFVAIPLCELAPDLVLPKSGLSIQQVASRFSPDSMEPLEQYTRDLREMLLGRQLFF